MRGCAWNVVVVAFYKAEDVDEQSLGDGLHDQGTVSSLLMLYLELDKLIIIHKLFLIFPWQLDDIGALVVDRDIPGIDMVAEHSMDDVIAQAHYLALKVGTEQIVVKNDIRSTEENLRLFEDERCVVDVELYTPLGTHDDEVHLGIERSHIGKVGDVVNDGNIAVIIVYDWILVLEVVKV